jgi:hypothetical protein
MIHVTYTKLRWCYDFFVCVYSAVNSFCPFSIWWTYWLLTPPWSYINVTECTMRSYKHTHWTKTHCLCVCVCGWVCVRRNQMHFFISGVSDGREKWKTPRDQTSTQTRKNQDVSIGVSNSKYRYVPSWCSMVRLEGLTARVRLLLALISRTVRLQEKNCPILPNFQGAFELRVTPEVPLFFWTYSRSWPTVTHPGYWPYSITGIHGNLQRGWSTDVGKHRILNTFWHAPWQLIVTGCVLEMWPLVPDSSD